MTNTEAKNAQEILLFDYEPTNYMISKVDLEFWLHHSETKVSSQMTMRRRKEASRKELTLNGEKLKLTKVSINGLEVAEEDYVCDDVSLTLKNLPEQEFILTIENIVNPEANTALDGLYKSGSIFCTQNEAEGFRKITYYLDRPDVMATFTTKIIADKSECPVLLSNGNLVESGDLEDGKHYAIWHDPFPKPCYLYALVAGNLGLVQDRYTTVSGREVDLRIYCDPGNENRCHHAMESLKNSMRWDEERFGLEYDLDIYMIVAVDSFNMGAMENKGLNIFNSVYVLADQQSATDDDFLGIESVIGHEYFHNWTGNRITCRDWFQLTLKEGLTVYRDQEFSADLNSRTVQRVSDVTLLRAHQFAEDAGPTAHPIKPKSYIEINNFYTSTIYNKGAEVIRMIETFVGVQGFRKGMDKYFELYDGQAVTTEDFIHAMSVANNIDLEQFKRWYDQAGTPTVVINESFKEGSYTLTVRQELPTTPGQPSCEKKPQHFPLRFALLDEHGHDISLDTQLLSITEIEQAFTFDLKAAGYDHHQKPALSINRGFSAPVVIKREVTLDEQYFLMAHDQDGFNRCEVAHLLAFKMIDGLMKGQKLDHDYKQAFLNVLKDDAIDCAQKSLMLTIPSVQLISQQYETLCVDKISDAKTLMQKELVSSFQDEMINLYQSTYDKGEYELDPVSMGKRSLTGLLLSYFSASSNETCHQVITDHYDHASNMTDELASLQALAYLGGDLWNDKKNHFYNKWQDNTLVMQKLIRMVAGRNVDTIIDDLVHMEQDPVYDDGVPNLIRSLWGSFMNNLPQFHHKSGRGYELLALKILEVDQKNPQLASRLSAAFRSYHKLDEKMKPLMKEQLNKIMNVQNLSSNVFEIISLTLGSES